MTGEERMKALPPKARQSRRLSVTLLHITLVELQMFRILIVFPFIVALCAAAPIPKDAKKPVLYFATKVGAKWVYEYEGGELEYSEVVTKVEKDSDGVFQVTVGALRDGEAHPWDKYEVSAKGVFLLETGKATWAPPMCYLKLPFKPGESWKNESVFLDDTVDHGENKLVAIEKVEVPAGKYEAIRIEHKPPPEPGAKAEQFTHTYWYAPDIGMVKMASTKKGVARVLKSFTPGKE